jgi:hypothetical protein
MVEQRVKLGTNGRLKLFLTWQEDAGKCSSLQFDCPAQTLRVVTGQVEKHW